MVMPRIPLGHAENFRKCIDAKLGFCACFPYTSMAILNIYGVHLRTKIIENKIQFEVQKLDYPCRNLVI